MRHSSSSVLCLAENKVGRDFVIGDFCGEFDLVLQAMRDENFNTFNDRLFSVGHLITDSSSLNACVRFLRHPSVYAIRTNAEQELVDLFEDGPPEREAVLALAAFDSSVSWLAQAGEAQQEQIVEVLRSLPTAISVGEGCLGFVHGGVPGRMGWATFLDGVYTGDSACCGAALYGDGSGKAAHVPGAGLVLVCFTPESDPCQGDANVTPILPGPFVLNIRTLIGELKKLEN